MLEPLVARFAELCLQVSRGRQGVDFCVVDPDSAGDWLSTPLERDLHAATLALVEALKAAPGELDGPSATRILVGLRQAEPARDSQRADVGYGYMDFESLCHGPLWDLRNALKDAVDAQRDAGVDVVAGTDRAVLEANNGEYFALLAVPRGEAKRAKFRFVLDKLARLTEGIGPEQAPESFAAADEVSGCLRELRFRLDWDVLEPTRRHYSDSGYSPSTHLLGGEPNPSRSSGAWRR